MIKDSSTSRSVEFENERRQRDFFNLAVGFMTVMGTYAIASSVVDDEAAARFNKWYATVQLHHDYVIFLGAWMGQASLFGVTPPTQEDLLAPFSGLPGSPMQLQWPPWYDQKSGETFCNYYISQAQKVTNSNILFYTEKGYMGLAQPGAQVGDEICIPFGCPLPLIIRRVENYHINLGGCYVYGMMKGEMIEEMEAGNIKTETFHFR